jgi:hypothetical protein
MGVTSGLRSALKRAPELVQSAIRRAGDKFRGIKRVPSRVGASTQDAAARVVRNDPDQFAKSVDDAGDTVNSLDAPGVTSHPLGTASDGKAVTNIKGQPPPPKDPTTDMPDGPPKVNSRWDAIKPYVKGGTVGTVLAGVGVGVFMAIAGVNLQNTDGVEVKITKIEKVADTEKTYKFTYETQGGQMCGPSGAKIPCIKNAFNPCKDDTFTFRSTHVTPTLDDVTAVVMDVEDGIVYFDLDLTDIGNGTPEWGFMTCHSSFKNQFRSNVRDTVQFMADVADDIADPLVGGFCDVVKLPIICPGGFEVGNWAMWVCIIFVLLSLSGVAYAIYSAVS